MAKAESKLRTSKDPSMPGHSIFQFSKSGKQTFLTFQDGIVFAEVNTHLTQVLDPLLSRGTLQFDAIADIDLLRELIGRTTKASDAVGRFNINIYGPETECKMVGKLLSIGKVYLQRPNYHRPGSEYNNPQFLKIPDAEISHSEINPLQKNTRVVTSVTYNDDLFQKTIADVYSTLKRGTGLHRVEGDRRVTTRLLK
jgi:SWI/SNF-related matrix-associated actin-dependent regulator of chromatin subfamily A3